MKRVLGFRVEAVAATSQALRNESSGHKACTMTDLDFAADMLDNALNAGPTVRLHVAGTLMIAGMFAAFMIGAMI